MGIKLNFYQGCADCRLTGYLCCDIKKRCDFASRDNSDQPTHQLSQIRISVAHIKKPRVLSYNERTEKADLGHRWPHNHFDGFVMASGLQIRVRFWKTIFLIFHPKHM